MASMTQGTPLAGSVGTGGRNKPIDVAEVEYLLRQSAPDPVVIDIDGVAGPDLLTGIVDFQTRTMGQANPSGIIKPRDGVARQLPFKPLLISPEATIHAAVRGSAAVNTVRFRTEAYARGARMLRMALGLRIVGWLEDPGIVELMLNPDGRLWMDRLKDGVADTSEKLSAANGERFEGLVQSRPSSRRPASRSASRPSPC